MQNKCFDFGYLLTLRSYRKCRFCKLKNSEASPAFRDIYFAKYYGKGGGGWLAGEKNENEELGKKIKERKKKGGKLHDKRGNRL